METVILIGAEDVRSAGVSIQSAASEIQRAASSFDSTAQTFRLFLDDWLLRFEEVLKENK